MTATEQLVRTRLAEFCASNLAAIELKKRLDARGLVGYVFGGVIRDLVTGTGVPRDLDVIVDGGFEDPDMRVTRSNHNEYHEFRDKLVADFQGKPGIVGMPGGAASNMDRAQVVIAGMPCDVWHIATQLGDPNWMSQVPGTTFLMLESIVAELTPDPARMQVHDAGFLDALARGVVECRPMQAHHIVPAAYAVKGLALAKRLGFELGPEFRTWLRRTLLGTSAALFLGMQEERYGGVVVGLDDVARMVPQIGAEACLRELKGRRAEGAQEALDALLSEVGEQPEMVVVEAFPDLPAYEG